MICEDKLHYEKFSDGSVVCIEDEIPFKIPKNWAWCRLKNIASNSANAFVDGPFGSNLKVEHYTENREVRLIQLNNIGDGFWRDEGKKYTTFKHAEELQRCRTFPDDIVIAKMMPAGRCIIVPQIEKQYIISSDCVKLSTQIYISKNYITNMINSPTIRKIIQDDTQGIGRSRTSLGKLKELLIPLPPVHEQHRISETVETLLELVDAIDSSKSDLSELIKQTKAKVLDLAIKGKLVPQDPNDEPADKLLEKIREEKENLIKEGKLKRDKNETFIFKNSDDNSYYEQIDGETVCIDDDLPFEIPDSWRWTRINNISKSVLYGISNSAENSGNSKLLRITDIQNNNVDWNKVPYTTVTIREKETYKLNSGDIVFARTGATVGKSYFIEECPNNAVYASYLIKITFYNQVLSNYISQFFNSNFYWQQITDKSSGIGQPNVNGTSLKEIILPLPPYQEQRKIVEKIKSIFNQLDTMQEIFLQ
jgi:type I restriction enzyme S subunit